jgi:hypothetical protein
MVAQCFLPLARIPFNLLLQSDPIDNAEVDASTAAFLYEEPEPTIPFCAWQDHS